MKVREWIEWLQQQPSENEVELCDPDTEWWLELLRKDQGPSWLPAPKDGVTAVYAEYYRRPRVGE